MRRWPVIVLAVSAAVLSFDALRAHALDAGVIPEHAILPRGLLAAVWALTIDVAVAAGILRVREDGRDWRAWLMLLLALAATVGFQAVSPERAVPPVALALAVVVLELPRRARREPGPVGERAVAAPAVPAQGGAAPGAVDPAHAAVIAELHHAKAGERAILAALAERGIEVPRAVVRGERRRLDATPSMNGNRP